MDEAELADLIERQTAANQFWIDHGPEASAPEVPDLSGLRHDEGALGWALAVDLDVASAATRATRADVLGLVVGNGARSSEVLVPALASMVRPDEHPIVLASVALALGGLWQERALPSLLELAQHRDGHVRHSAVSGLAWTWSHDHEAADHAVLLKALLRAADDDLGEVRDAARFGLTVLQARDPAVIQAFVDGLDDDHVDARVEAIRGLALLGDARAVEPMRQLLDGETCSRLMVDVAALVADARLLPGLEQWRDERRREDTDEEFWTAVDRAIDRCQPDAVGRAAVIESEILDVMRAQVEADGRGVTVDLEGRYPLTELVFDHPDDEERRQIWSDDLTRADAPANLDVGTALEVYRRVAEWIGLAPPRQG